MVNPIYIFILALGAAFLLSLIDKLGRKVSLTIFYGVLAAMTAISAQWLVALLNGTKTMMIYTAGFKPPFSINLQMGLEEAFFTLAVNVVGLLAGIYMMKKLNKTKVNGMILMLMMIMGINGLIMTRDMFNLFVFMEITSISTFALIGIDRGLKSLSAGFKYVMAGGIASVFFLIGTIYLYRFTGVLHIDSMVAAVDVASSQATFLAVFILLMSIVIELKPFPANGWALDVYEATDSGVTSLIASVSAAGMFFALHKISPILNDSLLYVLAGVGIVTFVASNLMGLKQENAKRLLGYSSIGQIGLVVGVYALMTQLGYTSTNKIVILIVGGLFFNHFIAKAGLFWLAGVVNKENINDWGALRKKPILLFAFGVFILTLIGLPPLPAFFSKWQLVMTLAAENQFLVIGAVLLGTLFEAVYLMRWLGKVIKSELVEDLKVAVNQWLPIVLMAAAVLALSVYAASVIPGGESLKIFYLPLLLVAALFILDFLPAWLKNAIVILAASAYTYIYRNDVDGYRIIFGIVFLIGTIVLLFPGFHVKGKRAGFYPFVAMMLGGLATMLLAKNTLQFFMAWELMTLGSYFMVMKGKKAEKPATSYITFGLGSAYVMMMGLALLYFSNGNSLDLATLANPTPYSTGIFILMAIGFMTKMAVMGLHVWQPGTYSEADGDTSAILSAVLTKAGLFGFMILLFAIGAPKVGKVDVLYIMSWIGALTAFFGNTQAIYQEDPKKLLAWASIGAMGYVIFSLSMQTYIGWITSIAFAVNHFLYKGLLFVAIAGVIYRVKTRNMYEMGGLIKRMPISFISVLIGIIAVSGVPPLSGYAGKWISFNAILETEWYLQGIVMSVAGVIAFLYCFRLIYTVFLGQLKDNHRHVKEAPLGYIIPQVIMMIAIMIFSARPGLILRTSGNFIIDKFPENVLTWENGTAHTQFGYWNGTWVLFATIGVFATAFILLTLMKRRNTVKAGQFNIVYAAERPSRPELTHVGYNFFAHYRKALGQFSFPLMQKFWKVVDDVFHSLSDAVRKIYTGNGQTYLVHIIVFVMVVYVIAIGG
jgi:formate hydrogenlyase subunit 3/multisubunit Na+/H+ antiporter MnhD subunit